MSEPTPEEEQRNYELGWLEAKIDLAVMKYENEKWLNEDKEKSNGSVKLQSDN